MLTGRRHDYVPLATTFILQKCWTVDSRCRRPLVAGWWNIRFFSTHEHAHILNC